MYPIEDLMPHRCGIFHVRGNLDKRGGSSTPFTVARREIGDYLQVDKVTCKTQNVQVHGDP